MAYVVMAYTVMANIVIAAGDVHETSGDAKAMYNLGTHMPVSTRLHTCPYTSPYICPYVAFIHVHALVYTCRYTCLHTCVRMRARARTHAFVNERVWARTTQAIPIKGHNYIRQAWHTSLGSSALTM